AESGVVRYVVIPKQVLAEEIRETNSIVDEAMSMADAIETNQTNDTLAAETYSNLEEEEMANYDPAFDPEKLMNGQVNHAEEDPKEDLKKVFIAQGKMQDPNAPPKTKDRVLHLKVSSLTDAVRQNFEQSKLREKQRKEENQTGKVHFSYVDKMITAQCLERSIAAVDIENFKSGFPF